MGDDRMKKLRDAEEELSALKAQLAAAHEESRVTSSSCSFL